MARPGLMRHRKFARLHRLIGSRVLARGHLELLWEVAYENGDDLVGDAGDLEALVEWTGEPGKLAEALVSAGFVDQAPDGLRVHDLWDHAPEYVRKRRAREVERQQKGAGLASPGGHRPPNGGQRRPDGAGDEPAAAEQRGPAPDGRTRAPAPAPAPAQQQQRAREAPSAPARAPHAQALIEKLATDGGWHLTHAATEKRAVLETALATTGTAAAAEFVGRDLAARAAKRAELPGSLGFYVGDLVGLAKRAAAEVDAPPAAALAVVDEGWMRLLPPERRAEAQERWAAKQAEVERDFHPDAVQRVLAGAAEAMRAEYLGTEGRA